MKLKMAENSLFAILLRSPWWISLLLVGVIALASRAILPAPYVVFGMMGGLPFLVIAAMAAWRQWQVPSAAQVVAAVARAGSMSWRDFSSVLEQGFVRQGYAVTRLHNAAADFILVKGGGTTLLSCKRWKAANQGVDPLRDLAAARKEHGADQCTYVSLSPMSEAARLYAREQGIHLMSQPELAQLLLG